MPGYLHGVESPVKAAVLTWRTSPLIHCMSAGTTAKLNQERVMAWVCIRYVVIRIYLKTQQTKTYQYHYLKVQYHQALTLSRSTV